MSDLGPELATVLAGAVEDSLGAVRIVDLKRLTAGANRQTWSFDAYGGGVTNRLIVQLDRPGEQLLSGSCAREGRLLRAAADHGVPVPEVVAVGEVPNPLDRSYVITRRLEGETIPRRLLRDDRWTAARDHFVTDCADALAHIHRIPLDAPGLEALPVVDDPVAVLRDVYLVLDDPHPAFELAFRWLDRHRPQFRAPALTHGDFRLGNLLLGEDGLVAVLDWELASIGDPTADLGWLCVRAWRFGAPGRVGGVGAVRDLLASYNESAGASLDPSALRWWQLYGTLRWGVICLQMGGGFRTGRTTSLEMAMIGRRVVETEADMVGLLRDVVVPA